MCNGHVSFIIRVHALNKTIPFQFKNCDILVWFWHSNDSYFTRFITIICVVHFEKKMNRDAIEKTESGFAYSRSTVQNNHGIGI